VIDSDVPLLSGAEVDVIESDRVRTDDLEVR
jgi:hypothetical protein